MNMKPRAIPKKIRIRLYREWAENYLSYTYLDSDDHPGICWRARHYMQARHIKWLQDRTNSWGVQSILRFPELMMLAFDSPPTREAVFRKSESSDSEYWKMYNIESYREAAELRATVLLLACHMAKTS